MLDFSILLFYNPKMIINDEFLETYVLMCQTISKPARLRIIQLIGNKKKNVGDLQKELDIPMSNLSNHLNDLYRSGVLGKENFSKIAFYLHDFIIWRNPNC